MCSRAVRQPRAGRGNFARFARLAAAMLDEREFFIRKAIRWILREVSKTRRELTLELLHANRVRVSRLTLQEGANYLLRSQRRALGLPAEAAWIAREQPPKTAAASR